MSAEDRLRPEVDVDEEEDSGEVVTMFQKKKRLLRWRLTGSSILPVAVLLCLAFGYAQAVAECMCKSFSRGRKKMNSFYARSVSPPRRDLTN